jgi:CMP-N-acetylneuraminic acid synthetase
MESTVNFIKLPLVTVYVTNHNYGKYIKQAVESVLNQTLEDFELIIIDDGSTDNSREIIETYQSNPKIRIIYQQNRGLNYTNNIALRAAFGKFIVRLDADDYFDPNALLVLSSALEKDDQIGLVFPDYYLVDDKGAILGMERRHAFEKDVSVFDMPAHGACTMIRREYLLELGGYDESFSCQDGYDLWIKFLNHYKVTNINTALFYYRQHGANLTRKEERILTTRADIKEKSVRTHGGHLKAIAIIPVKGKSADPSCIALNPLGGKRVLDWTVESALQAASIQKIVISSSDAAVQDYVSQRYKFEEKIDAIARPPELARLNVSAYETVRFVLGQPGIKKLEPQAFVLLSVEAPFLNPKFINDAINTLVLFNVETVIGVRPENALLYQHDGNGLKPILNQDRFTRLEREALYRYAGGITAGKIDYPQGEPVLAEGKRGHVVIDQRSAHTIRSDFDLAVAAYLANQDHSAG